MLPSTEAGMLSLYSTGRIQDTDRARNRNPSDGYRVMRVDFKDGEPVASITSKTAQIPVMENQDATRCSNSCFRPVGLAFDAKGRLFVSSDTTGEIFVIYGA